MKKNGFTLVEIIVCVAIISLVAGVVIFNSDKIFNNDQNKKKEELKTKVISAAEIYLSGNEGIAKPLYDGKGFIIVKVGDLKNEGLLGNDLLTDNKDEDVLVTLNREGYLEYTYPAESVNEGYLKIPNLVLAKGDTFSCDYDINFYDKDGNEYPEIISPETTKSNIDTTSNRYYCEKGRIDSGSDGNYIPGKYIIEYTYNINGVVRTKNRTITVLGDYSYEIDIDTTQSPTSEYIYNKKDNIIYTNNSSAKVLLNITNEEYKKGYVNFIYRVNDIKTNPEFINSTGITLTPGNNNIKIYALSKNSSKSEIAASEKSQNIKVQAVEKPSQLTANFLDSKGNKVSGNTWNIGKSLKLNCNSPIDVTYYYSFDNNADKSKWIEYTKDDQRQNKLLKNPTEKIYIYAKDAFKQESEIKAYDFYIDTIPNHPTVTSGTSTTYATSRTLNLSLPVKNKTNVINYYYITDSETAPSTTNGMAFTDTNSNLTLTNSNISSGKTAKYIYFKSCNLVGCSDWSPKYNLYLSGDINNYKNDKCTIVSSKGCFYKGTQNSNYVNYGGKKWRLYQIDESNQMHLILDGTTNSSSIYNFSKFEMKGYCSNNSCCNGGAGATAYSYSEPYTITETNNALTTFLGALTTNKKVISYNYNSTYTNGYPKLDNSSFTNKGNVLLNTITSTKLNSYNKKIGLLNYNELKEIAGCNNYTSATCQNSYLNINTKWGLATYTGYNTGIVKFGSSSNYKSPHTYYQYKTVAYQNNTLSNILGAVIVEVTQYSYIFDDNNDIERIFDNSEQVALRPVIVLSSDSKLMSGTGTTTNPYVIG